MHEEESMSTLKKKILKLLLKRPDHKISSKSLLAQFHGVMNLEDLIKMAQTLEEAGLIKSYVFGETLIYEMPKEVVEKLYHSIGKD